MKSNICRPTLTLICFIVLVSLVVFYVPSTARSAFRDDTPIYCPIVLMESVSLLSYSDAYPCHG